MNGHHQQRVHRPGNDTRGMSLIVMIAIVAILSIFALTALRALIREVDHAVARRESAVLKAQRTALENAMLRNGCIPNTNTWAQLVSAELGENAIKVATNSRGFSRVLLIQPGGWFTNLALPYTQGSTGLTVRPENARMMVASRLGPAGPFLSPTNFALLWNRRDELDDVKVERIVLDRLFVELRLVTAKREPTLGQYSIGADTPLYTAPVVQNSNPARYLFRGTKLWLYTSTGILDARQVLNKNGFYKYEQGIWKASAVAADMPGGLDLATVVKGFLEATPNTNTPFAGAQQKIAVDAMMRYMKGYIDWCKAGFPSAAKPGLLAIQTDMMIQCQELFKNDGLPSKDRFPINLEPCSP